MLVEKSKTEYTVTSNTMETLRASLLDFNNLCNTLTTYFLWKSLVLSIFSINYIKSNYSITNSLEM